MARMAANCHAVRLRRYAAIVIRWAEATIYGPDEHGRLERRSFGAARIDVEE
jgi:hypothetical protein